MLTPAARRLLLAVISLAGAILACARAEVPLHPETPVVSTPRHLVEASSSPSPTPFAQTSTPTSVPATPTPDVPTEVPSPVIAPSATPTVPTPTPTETQPSPTPTRSATATPVPPTRTPTPLRPLPTSPSGGGGSPPLPIPPNATFTQQFTVANEGGSLVGRPQDMRDRRTETWASLRGGDAAWIFDLGSPQNVAGLRVWAQPDANEPTTLRAIQVSGDGTVWTTVYTPSGDCGVPNCESLPQREFVERGFTPTAARFVRLNGGPTRFAFAEVEIAVLP